MFAWVASSHFLFFYLRRDISVSSGRKLPDLKYLANVMLMNGDCGKLQVFLHSLNNILGIFRINFASLKYKILLQTTVGWKPNPVLAGEDLLEADNSCYSTNWILPDGRSRLD